MNISKRAFWLVLIILALLTIFNPYEVGAQSPSNEQLLVGSWTNLHTEATLVFNADGTVSGTGWENLYNQATRRKQPPTHWAAAGNTIIIFIPGGDDSNARWNGTFIISSDGRTLIIGSFAFRRN